MNLEKKSLFNESIKRQETDLFELADSSVDPPHGTGDDAAVTTHVQVEQAVVDQSQSHLSGELRRHGRHLTGVMVGLVVEVIHAVQVGAVVSVSLNL